MICHYYLLIFTPFQQSNVYTEILTKKVDRFMHPQDQPTLSLAYIVASVNLVLSKTIWKQASRDAEPVKCIRGCFWLILLKYIMIFGIETTTLSDIVHVILGFGQALHPHLLRHDISNV